MAETSWNQFQPLTQMSWKIYSILSAVPFIQVCRWLEFHQSFRKVLAKAPTFFENKSVDFQRQYIEFLIFLYPEKNRGKQASSPEKIIALSNPVWISISDKLWKISWFEPEFDHKVINIFNKYCDCFVPIHLKHEKYVKKKKKYLCLLMIQFDKLGFLITN